MARTAADRERARLKKQRQRIRKAEAARLAAIAEAERLEREIARREILDEELAPAVMRNPVMAGDRMLVGPRVVIVNGRPLRGNVPMADPINTLALAPRQKRAAQALQADWRDVGAGLGVGAVDYLRTGGGGSGAAPAGHDAMLAQIATRVRLDAALSHAGAFAPSLARVVLDGVPVSHWSIEENERRGRADPPRQPLTDPRAWIAAGLDRLAAYYWPPEPITEQAIEILTLGPPREDYEVRVSIESAS